MNNLLLTFFLPIPKSTSHPIHIKHTSIWKYTTETSFLQKNLKFNKRPFPNNLWPTQFLLELMCEHFTSFFANKLTVRRGGVSHEELSWYIFKRFRYLHIWFELDAPPNTHSLFSNVQAKVCNVFYFRPKLFRQV